MPIHLYQFTYDLDWIEYPLLGDYHTSEIDFVFGNQWPPILHGFYKKSDYELSAAMGTYWTSMAASGTPNAVVVAKRGPVPYWSPFGHAALSNPS